MNDLIDRLRVSAEPVGKLLLEAAGALEAAQTRIAELTETLRAVVEIGNSERSREFAEVKKTLTKAHALLSTGSVAPPAPAIPPPMSAHTEAPPSEIVPVAEPQETKHHEEEIVSGMYKEIQNLLRYSA